MKLLILGAGASHHAGYPLASQLLAKVEEHVAMTALDNMRRAWEGWVEFRDSCPSFLELVVKNNNPEIVFTLPALLEVAAAEEDQHRQLLAIKESSDIGVKRAADALNLYHESDARRFHSSATIGLGHLRQTLDWYFLLHHVHDGHQRASREPLRTLLNTLAPGDVILTFNWDTTAERTLAELGKWSPASGYSFEKRLLVRSPLETDSPLAPMLSDSPVTVLKLHGSFGWYVSGADVLFENASFLEGFGFHNQGAPVRVVDPDFSTWHYQGDQVLVTPSFIKNVTHPILQSIWVAADRALRLCDAVEVWGYSLPPADGAARALLLRLRDRLDSGQVTVSVNDPGHTARERWRELLGDGVTANDRRLGSS